MWNKSDAVFLYCFHNILLIFLHSLFPYNTDLHFANTHLRQYTKKKNNHASIIQQKNKTYTILDPKLKQVIVCLYSSIPHTYAKNIFYSFNVLCYKKDQKRGTMKLPEVFKNLIVDIVISLFELNLSPLIQKGEHSKAFHEINISKLDSKQKYL